jgi:uncharacterized protein DUF402
MSLLTYHYRRRHLSGETGISTTTIPALARRDDAHSWIFDYPLAHPAYTEPVRGRRGTRTTAIARPEPVATRLWLWPDRPLRLHQQFDAAGQATLYRVDFATFPHRSQQTIHQTDLYLDLFVAADERDHAILDEDELAAAYDQGLITSGLRDRVLAQADELVDLLEAGQFRAWLATVCDAQFDLAQLTAKPAWTHRKHAPGEQDGWPAGVD